MEPPSEADASRRIQAIDAASVHRICSGQVVLDLAGAVKELVENALDAGATVVEVRLKEFGSELIEVADNGCGVSPTDYPALAAKYHTSKLHAFTDLTSLATFGFRGEALSSLCALCELSVVTRTEAEEAGTRLEYDAMGRLKSQVTAARARGTTVIIKDLFKPLAVRHKEFLRNLKREYGKLITLLQAYALICRGVRLMVTHGTGKGPRQTVLHTQGSASLKDNIITVLGGKAAGTMQPLEADLRSGECTVSGFVSLPSPGSGRATSDRQFFYVNGRPVDLPRAARALNEAYHSFNVQQTPAAVLDFRLPTDSYDVNVTPDKRHIMLHAEEALVAAFSEALLAAWAPSRETFAVGSAAATQPTTRGSNKRGREPRSAAGGDGGEDAWDSQAGDTSEDGGEERGSGDGKDDTDVSEDEPSPQRRDKVPRNTRASVAHVPTPMPNAAPQGMAPGSGDRGWPAGAATRAPQPSLFQSTISQFAAPSAAARGGGGVPGRDREVVPLADGDSDDNDAPQATVAPPAAGVPRSNAAELGPMSPPVAPSRSKATLVFDLAAVRAAREARVHAESAAAGARAQHQRFNASSLRNPLVAAADAATEAPAAAPSPEADAAATAELERVFSKADFASLSVVGQFNLGFILATLHGEDLFIIDQHASDEIFNFERLHRTTQLTRQPLLVPQPLELSPADAQTVLQHLDVFRANGFDIDEVHDAGDDPDQVSAPRLRLTAVPVSKNVTFDAGDFHELVALLDGRPVGTHPPSAAGPFGSLENGIIRPAKMRSMLAMRACRSSIMIGRALDKPQMARVLGNLTLLKAPWNCPHGRPTMRHLVADIGMLADKFGDD